MAAPQRSRPTEQPIPQEAIDFLDDKELRPGFNYDDVWGEEHVAAFTVAKITQADLLADVRDSLATALSSGQTFEEWAANIRPSLEESGWAEQSTHTVPSRLATIWDTNMRTARAVGQWDRIQRSKATHPYLKYELGPSTKHRALHADWAGTLLPVNHDWWSTHYPPNGFGCKCHVSAISEREAARLGGETDVPEGDADDGFGYNAGEVRQQQLDDYAEEKVSGLRQNDRLKGLLTGLLHAFDPEQHPKAADGKFTTTGNAGTKESLKEALHRHIKEGKLSGKKIVEALKAEGHDLPKWAENHPHSFVAHHKAALKDKEEPPKVEEPKVEHAAPSGPLTGTATSTDFDRANERWMDQLSPEEDAARLTWLKSFTSCKYLRDVDSGEYKSPGAVKELSDFKAALAKAPTYEGALYRGLHSVSAGDLQRLTTVGSKLEQTALSSWAHRAAVADYYMTREGSRRPFVMVHLERARGPLAMQDEVVLPKGYKYEVVRVESDKRETTVHVREVPNGG